MYAYTSNTFGNREKQFSRIYVLSEGMSPTAMKERRKMFYCERSELLIWQVHQFRLGCIKNCAH